MSDFEKQRAEALVRAVALAGLNDTDLEARVRIIAYAGKMGWFR